MGAVEVYADKPLGQGAFSDVYRGRWDSTTVAVKRLLQRDDGKYTREAQILSLLKHENIVGYFAILENELGTYDILLEIGSGITLAGALHRKLLNADHQKQSTIYQISEGLAYLHERGVLHLDLKPPNILFKNRQPGRIMIADFGMAKMAAQSKRAGAHKFKAPDSPFTEKSDVFSLASIACCVLHEKNPASREETFEIVLNVLTDEALYKNPVWLEALRRGVDSNFMIRPRAEHFRDAFSRDHAPQAYVAILAKSSSINGVSQNASRKSTSEVRVTVEASERPHEGTDESSAEGTYVLKIVLLFIIIIAICGGAYSASK